MKEDEVAVPDEVGLIMVSHYCYDAAAAVHADAVNDCYCRAQQ